jgi:4-diphosphocytidyl-2-C-methyl-D-erythritol kinase
MSIVAFSPKAATVVFAPAKVNLSLQVVGRRSDGYHLLDSLVVFAGVGDTLKFAPSDDLIMRIDGPTAVGLADAPDNIVLKAAHRLADAAGIRPRAAVTLTKRLPVAAGIGGGSADGAAALRGLCALWRLVADEDRLSRIGLGLGADVPVCLRCRPTRMTGVGEVLFAAPALPPAWLVLVNPGVAVSTPEVFKTRQGAFSAPAPLDTTPADAPALAEALKTRPNDLTAPAIRLQPVIRDVLAAIDTCRGCLLARMSGSGATCFGLFADETAARASATALSARQPGWWIAAAQMLG